MKKQWSVFSMQTRSWVLLMVCVLPWSVFVSCGSFSVFAPADTLPQKKFRASGGGTITTIGQLAPIVFGQYGVTDCLEVSAKYELYSFLVGARYGLFHSKEHGIALSLGVEGGWASIMRENEDTWKSRGVIAPGLIIGRRWDNIDLYLGSKVTYAITKKTGFEVFTAKLGVQIAVNDPFHILFEGGCSVQNLEGNEWINNEQQAYLIGEFSAGVAFVF